MTPKVAGWQEMLDALSLNSGDHASREEGMCVMEAAAYIAGEKHSDHPACACPVITAFMIAWNDRLPDDATRDRLLKPLLPLVVDTRSTKKVERVRSFMALDWFVREHVPAWFDLTPSLKPFGDALREADRIVSNATAEAVQERLAAAWAAARATAGDTAGDTAGAAARDAARAAARAAAGDAAWAAAGDAAWAAARAAARAAAGDAAWAAAWAALAPTVERLQASAQDLVRRMCAVKQ